MIRDEVFLDLYDVYGCCMEERCIAGVFFFSVSDRLDPVYEFRMLII